MDIKEIIENLKKTPDSLRNFNTDASSAQSKFGITETLLNQLIAYELPYDIENETKYFDEYDLSNISLYCKLPSIQNLAIRSWINTVRLLSETVMPPTQALIEYKIDLSEDITTKKNVDILTPNKGKVTVSVRNTPIIFSTKHTLVPIKNISNSIIKSIIEIVSSINFFLIPESLRWNIERINSAGLSECGGASRLLCIEAQKRGIEARQQFGLLLAKPFSTGHFWVELYINNEWCAVDPLLIKMLSLTHRGQHLSSHDILLLNGLFLPLATIDSYEKDRYGFEYPVLDHFKGLNYYPINPIVTAQKQEIPVSFPTSFIQIN